MPSAVLDSVFSKRSRVRRRISRFQHEFDTLEEGELRASFLTALVSGEFVLAKQVVDFEHDLLHVSEATVAPESLFVLAKQSYQSKNVPALLKILKDPAYLNNVTVQQHTIELLASLIYESDEQRTVLVDMGGIAAITKCMLKFPRNTALQRTACGLLCVLPFCRETCRFDFTGNSEICDRQEGLDLSIAEILLERGFFRECFLKAVTENLLDINPYSSDLGEIETYELLLANRQLSATLQSPFPSMKDPEAVHKRLYFFRMCLASLLQDPRICPETLSSFLFRKS